MKLIPLLLAATLAGGSLFAAEVEPEGDNPAGEEIINKYLSATEEQQSSLRGATMEVDIDAQVPKLQKQGKLHALRNISKLGKITYNMLNFIGDKTIKNEVIARYLTAETQSQTGPDISITPTNYKFNFKGLKEMDDHQVYVFHLSPRHKRVGLFKGELWLDPQTYMPVRESGKFVKSPSIFLKKMEFVRTYAVENGVAIPQRLESRVDTRIFGRVELNINFTHFAKEPEPSSVATTAVDTQ